MKRRHILPTVTALAGFLIGTQFGDGRERVAHAQDMQEYYVGTEWGSVRAAGNKYLVFENDEGEVRLVHPFEFNPSTKMLRVERVFRRR